jgi:PII-like signaling protein
VLKARKCGLAGATLLRGAMVYGASSHLHTSKILRLSADLPLVIEIVDTEEKINAFLPALDGMMGGGLVTLEKVRVVRYRDGGKTSSATCASHGNGAFGQPMGLGMLKEIKQVEARPLRNLLRRYIQISSHSERGEESHLF